MPLGYLVIWSLRQRSALALLNLQCKGIKIIITIKTLHCYLTHFNRMNPLQQRLRYFVDTLEMSVQAFERQCGIKTGTASRMTEKSYSSTFHKIQKTHPELNMEWLKTGKGDMLRQPPAIDASRNNSDGDSAIFGNILKVGDPGTLKKEETQKCALEIEVEHLRSLLGERGKLVAQLEERIDELKERNTELKEQLAKYRQP